MKLEQLAKLRELQETRMQYEYRVTHAQRDLDVYGVEGFRLIHVEDTAAGPLWVMERMTLPLGKLHDAVQAIPQEAQGLGVSVGAPDWLAEELEES